MRLNKAAYMSALTLMLLAAQAQAGTPQCPSQKFDRFIKAYANSERLQRRFTVFPLTFSGIATDTYDYDPKPAILQEQDADFPLLPLQAERKRSNIRVKEIVRGEGKATVHLSIPDSDAYDVDFVFTRREGCWFLTRIDNASL